jgi:hypothetical protein
LPDEDVYSLGVLTTGHYTLDVDEYIWDFSSSNNGYVTRFGVIVKSGAQAIIMRRLAAGLLA